METLITVLHVIVAAFLILVVLLQTGQSDMGTSFGGSGSGSVLGAAGANKFMTRLTTIAAAVFMFTSISLTILGGAETGSSSVVEDIPDAPPPATKQATPEEQAAAEEAAPAETAAEGDAAPAEAATEGEAAPEAAAEEAPAEEAPAEAETPAQ